MLVVNTQNSLADAPDPPSTSDTVMQIVIFEIGPQRYGLPVDLVREVVLLPALLELAGAAAGLCGLLNRHGSYISVIDGRMMVGLPHYATLDSQVLLAGTTAAEVGLLVDRVSGVEQLALSQATALDRRSVGVFLDRVVSTAAGPILLLHFPALLAMTPALSRPTDAT